jgi:hypothetical protein
MGGGRDRLIVWSGFTFVAFYVIGLALTTYDAIPSLDEPLSALPVFYADAGNRIPVLLGGILLAISAPCLLAFVTAATSGPSSDAVVASIARAAAGMFAASIAIGAIALALVAGELTFRTVPQPSAELERWLAEFGYALVLVPGMIAAATSLTALGWSRPVGLRQPVAGATYGVAAISLAALPIAIATGTLLWSQIPLAGWVTWAAASATRATDTAGSVQARTP